MTRRKTQKGLVKSREGLPVLIITPSAVYGHDQGEWWCETDARPRYSIPIWTRVFPSPIN
jgi:hypothetical protein